MITNKFTAYGLTVAVAFAAAVVLLLASAPTSASADKGTTADAARSVTTSGAENGVGTASPANQVTLTSTHVSGTEACIDGTFSTSSLTNTAVGAPTNPGCTTITTTINAADAAGTATTLTVVSTTGFPDSGSLILDDDGDANLATGGIEIVDYTGKTATTFTGVTRNRAGTSGLPLTVGDNVWPVVYSQITILDLSATATTVNLADASNFVVGGTVDPDVIIDPGGGNEVIETLSARTGNTLTITSGHANVYPVGEYLAQISGVNTDTGVVTVTPTAGSTEASFNYQYLANGETSTAGTVSLTVVSNNPDAADGEVTVSATTPTPIPVIAPLSGSDSSEIAGVGGGGPVVAAWAFSVLPTKGILTLPATAPICTNTTGTPAPAVGEVLTNCVGQVVYTPLLGATGTDSFQYTLSNGGETSAAATVTIILPGGSSTTPGAGFTPDIVAGFNLTAYNGGTLSQLANDAAAAGATTVSVTVGGAFLTHVVGAPDFVNAAFAANFSDGNVPAGTQVFVIAGS